MEPVPLLRGDNQEKEAYLCPKCQTIWAVDAFESAKRCCLCMDCSVFIGPKRSLNGRCYDCEKVAIRTREQKAQDAAIKIPSPEYDGPVFSGIDDYHMSWQDYVDDYHFSREADAPPLPPPAWAAKSEKLSLDPVRVLEDLLEDHYDGAWENLKDEKELCEFLRVWVAKQTIETFYPDHTRLIMPVPDDRYQD